VYVKYGSQAQLYQQERKAAVTDTEENAIESEKKTLVAAQVDTLGLDSESDEECSLDGWASDESRNDIKLGEEFDTVYKRYKTACKALQWKELFPKLPWAKKEVKFLFSLWDVDMGHGKEAYQAGSRQEALWALTNDGSCISWLVRLEAF
jgi:hypothetical protein